MALRREPHRGLKGLKRVTKRIKEIEVDEDDNHASVTANENSNNIHRCGLSQDEEKICDSGNKKPRNEEKISNNLEPTAEVNYDWNMMGSPFDNEKYFYTEAINKDLHPNGGSLKYEYPSETEEGIASTKSRNDVIIEFINMEESYLRKTEYVIEILQYLKDHNIYPNIEAILGNVEDIYRVMEKIYSILKTCTSIDDIGRAFMDNIPVFEYYIEYLRSNLNLEQYPIKEFENVIKQIGVDSEETFTWESYMPHPAETLGRYKFLLDDLQRAQTQDDEFSQYLEKALNLMDIKISEANTLMAINSIQHSTIDLYNGGRFLMRNTFSIKGQYQSEIFLFEKYMVFCKEIENHPNLYYYNDSIEMEKLTLIPTNDSMNIQISYFRSFNKHEDINRYQLDIESTSKEVNTKWIAEITRLLMNQLQFYREQFAKLNIIEGVNANRKVEKEQGNEGENSLRKRLLQEEEYTIHNESSSQIAQPQEKEILDEKSASGEDISKDKESILHDESSVAQNEEGETMLYEESNEGALADETLDENLSSRSEVLRSDSLESKGDPPEMIIDEFIQMEGEYVGELRHINEIFGATDVGLYVPILGKNIENILKATKIFYAVLEKCDSASSIGKIFLDNIHILDFYTDFIRNNATYYRQRDKIDREEELRRNDYQRLMDSYYLNLIFTKPEKYKLLLERLQRKYAELGQTFKLLDDALKLVHEKIAHAITLKTTDSIENFSVDVQKTGYFVMKESFKVDHKPNRMVFLFKESVIICREDKTRPDTYIYMDSIEMTNLTIGLNQKSLSFELVDTPKSKLNLKWKRTFLLETSRRNVNEKWINEIQSLLGKYRHKR